MSRAPKAVHHALVDREARSDLYDRLDRLVDAHHPELRRAGCRIALAWNTGWRPDRDGKIVLGRCRRCTDLERELAPYDFVIVLLQDFWESEDVTDAQRDALLDHELCHADVAYSDDGEPRLDERDRPVFRTRKHDVEEFWAIADRHGIWKRDLEVLAEALLRTRGITPTA